MAACLTVMVVGSDCWGRGTVTCPAASIIDRAKVRSAVVGSPPFRQAVELLAGLALPLAGSK
ncbi:hypothetical protein ACH4F6_30680 [Streptomyces sp. NPDC017936]|uniref:hypothetical protein n=1 Tax=Streptomyces sp. NPDC017936 TaxID=3365016 RepID=UPI0037B8FDDB